MLRQVVLAMDRYNGRLVIRLDRSLAPTRFPCFEMPVNFRKNLLATLVALASNLPGALAQEAPAQAKLLDNPLAQGQTQSPTPLFRAVSWPENLIPAGAGNTLARIRYINNRPVALSTHSNNNLTRTLHRIQCIAQQVFNDPFKQLGRKH